MNDDKRQQSIVFQNAMAHATKIAIHNSQGEKVNPVDVIKLARNIALISLDPFREIKGDQK